MRFKILKFTFLLSATLILTVLTGKSNAQEVSFLRGKPFNNITMETSLKPFKKNDKTYIRAVAKEMFVQWHALLRHADTVSVMLWTGDGSEILEYKGTPVTAAGMGAIHWKSQHQTRGKLRPKRAVHSRAGILLSRKSTQIHVWRPEIHCAGIERKKATK
jgi:hypothetical protein